MPIVRRSNLYSCKLVGVLLGLTSAAVLSACKPAPAVVVADVSRQIEEAKPKAQEEAEANARLRFPRCLFLVANGEQVAVPKSIVDSDQYKACIQGEARQSMNDEAFRAAVSALYPMAGLEESKNFHCFDFNGDETCTAQGDMGASRDGYVDVIFAPKGALKKVGITWKGHSMGRKLRTLWGEPAGTVETSDGTKYFYQAQDYPYVIVAIGNAETRVSTVFEL